MRGLLRTGPCPTRGRFGRAGQLDEVDTAGGTSIVSMLVSLALLAVLVQSLAPDFVRWRDRQQLLGAARNLSLTVAGMRAAAAASGRSRGLAFAYDEEGNSLSWQVIEDGDGDGVRRSDIRTGVDGAIAATVNLGRAYAGVLSGRPAGVPPVGGGSAGVGGVAFGRSRILSCSPAGSATSGTLYLTNRHGDGVALRVYGATSRLSLWSWQPAARDWARLW